MSSSKGKDGDAFNRIDRNEAVTSSDQFIVDFFISANLKNRIFTFVTKGPLQVITKVDKNHGEGI